jgi:hypothetical protein
MLLQVQIMFIASYSYLQLQALHFQLRSEVTHPNFLATMPRQSHLVAHIVLLCTAGMEFGSGCSEAFGSQTRTQDSNIAFLVLGFCILLRV